MKTTISFILSFLFVLILGFLQATEVKITASDAEYDDQFGNSVSISGDYAIVGAHYEDTGGNSAGAAYIFYRSGTNWTQQVKITASDAHTFGGFGSSVSISGDYAIVGASGGSGTAYIFYRSGTSWTEQAKITASDAEAWDFFGCSVSISGDYTIVGAYGESSYTGASYIFYRSGTNWNQQAKITASDAQANDQFGCSVSISGDYAIVGAYLEAAGGIGAGALYSYLRNGVTWSEKSKITASDAQANDQFGCSVSISGDYAIVGACYEDHGGIDNAGAAYIYESIADLYLPVILSSFTAQYLNESPILCWTTQSETNNLGWNVYRSEIEEIEEAIQINTELIPGAGTTTEPTEYIYEDEYEIEYEETYWYWLETRGISGLTETYGPISLLIQEEGDEPESPDLPKIYGLHQNYPNPFNPNTEISFMMKEDCIAELSVYNIKGEKIATLFRNKPVFKDELIRVSWDGTKYGSGIYFYQMKAGKYTSTKKMILMK